MMRKAGLAAGIAIALAMALALIGCSNSVTLDRQVTIGGMTLKVPSSFVETVNDGSFGNTIYVNSQYTDKKGNGIYVSANSGKYYMQLTVQDHLDSYKETCAEDKNAHDIYANKVSERVIDGAQVVICEQGMQTTTDGKEYKLDSTVAYIFSSKAQYEIAVYGNDIPIDDVLNTVSL